MGRRGRPTIAAVAIVVLVGWAAVPAAAGDELPAVDVELDVAPDAVTVDWSVWAEKLGAGVTGWRLERAEGDAWKAAATLGAAERTWEDRDVTPGETRRYRVVALDGSGDRATSEPIAEVVPHDHFLIPSWVEPGDGERETRVVVQAFRFWEKRRRWVRSRAPMAAILAVGESVHGITVIDAGHDVEERRSPAGRRRELVRRRWVKLRYADGTTQTVEDTAVPRSVLRVKLSELHGDIVHRHRPARDLEAIATRGAVTVSWKDALGNAYVRITGYEIERRAAGEDAWTSLGPVALDGPPRRFVDTSVVAGTRYVYRVTSTAEMDREGTMALYAFGRPIPDHLDLPDDARRRTTEPSAEVRVPADIRLVPLFIEKTVPKHAVIAVSRWDPKTDDWAKPKTRRVPLGGDVAGAELLDAGEDTRRETLPGGDVRETVVPWIRVRHADGREERIEGAP